MRHASLAALGALLVFAMPALAQDAPVEQARAEQFN